MFKSYIIVVPPISPHFSNMCNVVMVAVEELCNVASGNGMLGAVAECGGCGGGSTGS